VDGSTLPPHSPLLARRNSRCYCRLTCHSRDTLTYRLPRHSHAAAAPRHTHLPAPACCACQLRFCTRVTTTCLHLPPAYTHAPAYFAHVLPDRRGPLTFCDVNYYCRRFKFGLLVGSAHWLVYLTRMPHGFMQPYWVVTYRYKLFAHIIRLYQLLTYHRRSSLPMPSGLDIPLEFLDSLLRWDHRDQLLPLTRPAFPAVPRRRGSTFAVSHFVLSGNVRALPFIFLYTLTGIVAAVRRGIIVAWTRMLRFRAVVFLHRLPVRCSVADPYH